MKLISDRGTKKVNMCSDETLKPPIRDRVAFRYSEEELEFFEYAVKYSDAKTHTEAIRYAIEFMYKLSEKDRYGSRVDIRDEKGNTVIKCRITRSENDAGAYTYRKEIKLGAEVSRLMHDIRRECFAFKYSSASAIIRAALGWYVIALRNLTNNNAVYEISNHYTRELRVPGMSTISTITHSTIKEDPRQNVEIRGNKVINFSNVVRIRDSYNIAQRNEISFSLLNQLKDQKNELSLRARKLANGSSGDPKDAFLVEGDYAKIDVKLTTCISLLWFTWADDISSIVECDWFADIVQTVLEVRTKYYKNHQSVIAASFSEKQALQIKSNDILNSISIMEQSVTGEYDSVISYRLSLCSSLSEAISVAMEVESLTLLHARYDFGDNKSAFPELCFLDEFMVIDIIRQIVRLLVHLPFNGLIHDVVTFSRTINVENSRINKFVSLEQTMRDMAVAKMLSQYMVFGEIFTSFITIDSYDFHLDMSDWQGGGVSTNFPYSLREKIALSTHIDGDSKNKRNPVCFKHNENSIIARMDKQRLICLMDDRMEGSNSEHLYATEELKTSMDQLNFNYHDLIA